MSGRSGRRPLGRGLAALLGEGAPAPDAAAPAPRLVPTERIRPGPLQPRRRFAEEELAALARSIREKGVLQPLLVRPCGDAVEESFELVAGERRWRAARQIGLAEVPVVVRALGDSEALEVALVENLQREDLSPLEEAEAYDRLLREFGRTQASLAAALGKSRSHIANTVRLLALPEAVRQRLEAGELSAGHGRALLAAADPVALAAEIVRRGLNVRATERLVRRRAAPPRLCGRDADRTALARDLSAALGLRVTFAANKRGGALTLHFASNEELERILARLRGG